MLNRDVYNTKSLKTITDISAELWKSLTLKTIFKLWKILIFNKYGLTWFWRALSMFIARDFSFTAHQCNLCPTRRRRDKLYWKALTFTWRRSLSYRNSKYNVETSADLTSRNHYKVKRPSGHYIKQIFMPAKWVIDFHFFFFYIYPQIQT